MNVSEGNIVANNTANLNSQFGINLWNSNNNTLINNTANSNNETGIWLNYSSYNTLTNNTASSNGEFGVWLRRSPYNTLCGNVMDHNGLVSLAGVQSDAVEYWNNDIDTSNTINGGPLYYFYGVNDTIIEGLDAKRVIVAGCNNITIRNINYSDGDHVTLVFTNNSLVENCTVTNNNAAGFALVWSHYNRLINNNASYSRGGFNLQVSTHNNISSNFISNNSEYGVDLRYSSSNNLIYNNYFENTNNALDNGNNIWNISQTPGTNIIGGSLLGGNYWSDYTGSDNNGDGLGDTMLPYNSSGGIENGGDWLPLVKPALSIFDTGKGTYPSIMGTHEGTIEPSDNISINKLYTYPCPGTGGHTESIELYDNDTLIANGTWNGYQGDWHNITIHNLTGGAPYVTLLKDHEYRYTIKTGSYPQIIHESSKDVTGGTITCTDFEDANGKTYTDWIPAIKLY